jgi:hypothetical protein
MSVLFEISNFALGGQGIKWFKYGYRKGFGALDVQVFCTFP